MKNFYKVLSVIMLIAVILFGLFIYPGMYRYISVDRGDNSLAIRVHVITGKTEVLNLVEGYWVNIEK